MIGIAPLPERLHDAKPKPKLAWLEDVVELASVSWGSYLPGISLSKEERPAFPPAFDQIVYRKTKGIGGHAMRQTAFSRRQVPHD